MTYHTRIHRHVDSPGAMTRAVADDMIAIFGPGVRPAAVPPSTWRQTSVRSGRRRALIVAAAGSVLAATVATGIFAGMNAAGDPAVARTSVGVDRSPAPTRRAAVALEPPTSIAAVTTVSPAPVPSLTPAPGTASTAVPQAAPVALASLTRPPAALPPAISPPPPPAPAVVRQPPPAPVARPVAPAAAAPRRNPCDVSGEACFAARIDTAEQRLTDAYEEAGLLGVRPRLLRDYRREWERARSEAAEQPQYALRLYAMITADLHTLAEDAETGGRDTRR